MVGLSLGGYGHNRNQEATVWVGGLEPQCTEELLFELFTQTGPVADVSMPRDKVTGQHQNYGFVEFNGPDDADYAIRIMTVLWCRA
jgi:splicing factor 3B subunit 4